MKTAGQDKPNLTVNTASIYSTSSVPALFSLNTCNIYTHFSLLFPPFPLLPGRCILFCYLLGSLGGADGELQPNKYGRPQHLSIHVYKERYTSSLWVWLWRCAHLSPLPCFEIRSVYYSIAKPMATRTPTRRSNVIVSERRSFFSSLQPLVPDFANPLSLWKRKKHLEANQERETNRTFRFKIVFSIEYFSFLPPSRC